MTGDKKVVLDNVIKNIEKQYGKRFDNDPW